MATNNLGTERRVVLVAQPKQVVKIRGQISGLYGRQGPAGASAYDIAVAEGFTGTREEWLASLVGPAGSGVISEADIDPAPDNRLTLRPDGLYVPPTDSLILSSTNW